MATHADVQLSFFEYRAAYREPMSSTQTLYTEMPQIVLRALKEWNVGLENVAYRQNATNLGEVSVTFGLFGGRIGFTVGLGSASLVVKDPNWSETELVARICKAGLTAVVESGDVVIAQQRATITMHLRPRLGQIRDFVARVIRPSDGVLTGPDIKAYGFSVYREDCSWVVDASVLYPSALFIRIERGVAPSVPFAEIANLLRKEETDLLGLLGLEVA